MNDELMNQLVEFNELLSEAMARSGVFYRICHDLEVWARLRIPTISAGHSGLKPATCSD